LVEPPTATQFNVSKQTHTPMFVWYWGYPASLRTIPNNLKKPHIWAEMPIESLASQQRVDHQRLLNLMKVTMNFTP
jgi:hypothetical protein